MTASAWPALNAAARRLVLSDGRTLDYDAISLALISRQQDQTSLSTFYPQGAPAIGPVAKSTM